MHSHSPDPTSPTGASHWAHIHVNWTDTDWDPVLFTVESRYCLHFTDRHAQVWRRRRERFQDANIFQYDHYSECSIMVWAGISRGGRTDLHIVMTDLHIVMTDMMTGNRTPVHRHGRNRSTSSCQGG